MLNNESLVKRKYSKSGLDVNLVRLFLLLVLAFYQISGELFGSLLNNPYLCTRNVIAVKFTDVKIYEEFL